VEFLIQNVLTVVPLSGQIREQIIEDTLKGAAPAKYAWPEKGLLEDISSAVRDICVPTLILAGENDQVEKIDFPTKMQVRSGHSCVASLSFATGAIDSLPWVINGRPLSKGLHYRRV
jgi:pimeloyl-ACP methyl ester carboxylesterase